MTDDNGTPGNAADDFNATYTSGDTNSNSQLDVGETWTYSASRTVVAGQYHQHRHGNGTGNAQSVMDTDPANYFGSAPSVALRSFIVNNDADLPPGITLEAGSTMVVGYLVTNTGNVALQSIALSDDNGTPGLAADDSSPDYLAGDANTDGKLDLGEAWMFIARIPVLAGQHTHIAHVMATDSISQVATASNPNNYVGIVPGNADFNGDTIVNKSDYVAWRKNTGMTSGAAQSQGDANGDGAVNNVDYDIWRSQVGTSPGAVGSTAITSPSAATLAISVFGAEPDVVETSFAVPSDKARASSSVHSAAFAAFAIEQPERRFIRHAAIPRKPHVSIRSEGESQSLLNVLTRQQLRIPARLGIESESRNPISNRAMFAKGTLKRRRRLDVRFPKRRRYPNQHSRAADWPSHWVGESCSRATAQGILQFAQHGLNHMNLRTICLTTVTFRWHHER